MTGFPGQIHIQECGPRDGLQIEPAELSVRQKVEMITGLVATGITEIEIGSLVRPDLVPQMASTPAVIEALGPAPAGVAYRARYLNLKGLKIAQRHAGSIAMEGRIALTASEAFLRRNSNSSVEESFADAAIWVDSYRQHGVPVDTIGVMAAFGCNIEGDVPQSRVLGFIARAEQLLSACGERLTRLSLMDTMAWATPASIRSLVGAVRERWPGVRVNLHLHDTRGLAMANALAALELGVDDFDASVGGIGGCPFAGHAGAAGNICTEDLVLMCEEMGIATGIDLEALIEVARDTERALGRTVPGRTLRGGSLQSRRRFATAG